MRMRGERVERAGAYVRDGSRGATRDVCDAGMAMSSDGDGGRTGRTPSTRCVMLELAATGADGGCVHVCQHAACRER